MAEVKKNFVEELPIEIGSSEQISSIIKIVDKMLELCQSRYAVKQTFIKYLCSALEPKRITEKLESIESISFKDFCLELKKQKVKLSASMQMELLPLFDQKKQEIEAFTSRIKIFQTQLDDEVFAIYGIDSVAANQIRSEMIIDI